MTYVDSRGREFEQPADLVLLTFTFNNVRLMLHSGIAPYGQSPTPASSAQLRLPDAEQRDDVLRGRSTSTASGCGRPGMAVDEFNSDSLRPWRPQVHRRRIHQIGKQRCAAD